MHHPETVSFGREFVPEFVARDAWSQQWLDACVARRNATFNREFEEERLRSFSGPPVVLELTFRATVDRAEVHARMADLELVLSNDVVPPLRGARRATPGETFELAERLFLGEGRIGCVDLVEDVFWHPRARFAAVVFDFPDETTFDDLGSLLGVSVAVVEMQSPLLAPRIAERLREWCNRTGRDAAVGWFYAEVPRSLLQVAVLLEKWDGTGRAALTSSSANATAPSPNRR